MGAAGAADTEHPCTDTQLTYLFEDDFDIDEEEDNHGDEEEDEEDDTLLSDDDEESDRGSVVGEETDFNNKIEDIIDEYNSDQFEILDSWYEDQCCFPFIICYLFIRFAFTTNIVISYTASYIYLWSRHI